MKRTTTCGMCCGSGGTIAGLAILAWLGAPTIIAAVSSIGLGFTLTSPVLIPVIVVALILTGWGLWLGFRTHGRAEPFMVGLVGAAATVAGLFTWKAIAVIGFGTVIGTIAWSTLLILRPAVPASE